MVILFACATQTRTAKQNHSLFWVLHYHFRWHSTELKTSFSISGLQQTHWASWWCETHQSAPFTHEASANCLLVSNPHGNYWKHPTSTTRNIVLQHAPQLNNVFTCLDIKMCFLSFLRYFIHSKGGGRQCHVNLQPINLNNWLYMSAHNMLLEQLTSTDLLSYYYNHNLMQNIDSAQVNRLVITTKWSIKLL